MRASSCRSRPRPRPATVHETGFFRACWYRRTVAVPKLDPGHRLMLHFGAVDYVATVWCNDQFAARHEGGYTPFSVDVTPFLDAGDLTIVVCADDDPLDLAKPRGKQDWQLKPHSIWYTRTTGIWQTVWWEVVPTTRIDRLRWTPNLERWEIGLEAWLCGPNSGRLRMHVHLSVGDTVIADDTFTVISGEVHRRIALSDPGIDDYRNELLWAPERPTLIAARIELWADRADRIDAVTSYTALRAVAVQRDRFVLNGRPYFLRLVLDQGYWPETGITAPNDEALRRDVELAKAMGFNGVRKHQKIEDPRYLYWADQLGLLVWSEMPSAYRFTQIVGRARLAAVDRGDDPRLQPSLRRRLGAVQRVVGRAEPARQPERAALRAGAVSPDEDPRRDAAGHRQRWMGERRHRHDRHPRLRQPAGADRAALSRRRGAAAAVPPRASRRPPAGARRRIAARSSRSCCRSSAASPARTSRAPGATRAARPAICRSATRACSRSCDRSRCSRASATRSSPTPSRKQTACCARTVSRSFRSTEIARATRGPDPRSTEAIDPLAAVGLSDDDER